MKYKYRLFDLDDRFMSENMDFESSDRNAAVEYVRGLLKDMPYRIGKRTIRGAEIYGPDFQDGKDVQLKLLKYEYRLLNINGRYMSKKITFESENHNTAEEYVNKILEDLPYKIGRSTIQGAVIYGDDFLEGRDIIYKMQEGMVF